MNRSMFRRAAVGAVLGCAALLAAVTVSSAVSSAAQAAPAVKHPNQQASHTYFAAGQDIEGPALYKPACSVKFDCAVSGDSTAFLYRMRWTQWSATKAVGTGSYLLNSCTPDCAAGTFYNVPIVVTFTNPVKACSGKSVRWYWTKAAFRFTHTLPPGLRGDNGPVNPWVFTGVAQQARATCR
jgi:hypothetical protein